MQLYHNKQYHDSNSGVARGYDGGGPRGITGGITSYLEVIPKNLAREKYFEGRNYRKGLQKSRRWPKIERLQKKGRQKSFGVRDKNLEGRQI